MVLTYFVLTTNSALYHLLVQTKVLFVASFSLYSSFQHLASFTTSLSFLLEDSSYSKNYQPRATDKKVLQLLIWVPISDRKSLIGKNIPASFTDKEVF